MNMSSFFFQSPSAVGSSALQALIQSAEGSSGGGGILAWATKYGLESLLRADSIRRLLANHRFELTIGTDAITDYSAIQAARTFLAEFENLDIKFIVNSGSSLFHPKLFWFQRPTDFRLVVGSGNLTRGGLSGNWEAFAIQDYPTSASEDFHSTLVDWLGSVEPGVVDIDDPRLIEAIVMNAGDERQIKGARRLGRIDEAIALDRLGQEVDQWLVAELAKNRVNAAGQSMFSQASFDQATFASFFGYAGAEFDLNLLPVDGGGIVGALETRRGRFKPASVNYYFELGAAAGLAYPSSGRPIAVFGRLQSGGFIYELVLPGRDGHDALEMLLAQELGAAASRMRRLVVSSDQLASAWGDAPVIAASRSLRG